MKKIILFILLFSDIIFAFKSSMLEETIQRQYNNKDLEIQKNRKSELKIEELEYGITYSSYLNKIGVEKENLKKIKNDEINRISRINTTFNGLELKNTYLIFCGEYYCGWEGEYKAYDREEFFDLFLIMSKKVNKEIPLIIENNRYFLKFSIENKKEENNFFIESNFLKYDAETKTVSETERNFYITFKFKGKNYFDFERKINNQKNEKKYEKKQESVKKVEEFRKKF